MTINAADFRSYVIAPALAALAPAGIPVTKAAADLLMATAAQESDLGTWLHQRAGGPALGIFQDETIDTLVAHFTAKQIAALFIIMPAQPTGTTLAAWISANIEGNLILAAAICRLHYWYATTEPLPKDTITGLWVYYKTFYNSDLGAATMAEFLDSIKLTDLGSLPMN